jgi:hypothetical protein
LFACVKVPLKFVFAASVRFTLVVVIPVPLIWYPAVRVAGLSPSAYTYTSYPAEFAGRPETVTVVIPPTVSRYPRIIRAFPAVSVIAKFHIPFVFHTAVAPVAVPDSSTNACPVAFDCPLALFQFAFATTPATSVLPMAVPCPTKSMLITPVPAVVTTSVTVAVCVTLPLVPVIVKVDVPAGVVPVVVTVNVEFPAPVTVAGEKPAVAPVGNPLAASVTTPPNPFNDPIVVVYVAALL